MFNLILLEIYLEMTYVSQNLVIYILNIQNYFFFYLQFELTSIICVIVGLLHIHLC